MVRGVVGLALEGEALRIPRERKFFAREDFGDDGVGGGVAPEDEVLVVEVGGGDRGIVFHDQFAAENVAPHFCRVGEFGGGPGADFGIERLAGGADEDEGVHERIVDGAAEAGHFAGLLAPASVGVGVVLVRPLAVCFHEPVVGDDFADGDGLAVDGRGEACGAVQHNAQDGDVARGDFETFWGRELHGDIGALPGFFELHNLDTIGDGVAERVGGEAALGGPERARLGGELVEAGGELFLGVGVVFVRGLRADEVLELHALGGGGRGHDVGGLFLRIEFAAVGDGRDVEEISGRGGGVVPVPEFLLPPGALGFVGGEGFGVEGGLGETSAGRGGGPEAGEVGGEVPSARAAHGKTADNDATGVDFIEFSDELDGLHDVDFAGEFGGVAEAAVGMEYDGIGGNDFAGGFFALGHEGELRALFVATGEDDVETAGGDRNGRGGGGGRSGGAFPSGGDDEGVGLDGVVEFGAVTADDGAGRFEPRGFAGAESGGAFAADGEEVARGVELFEVEELVVAERPVDGFVKDFDVGEEGEEGGLASGGELGAEGRNFGGE